MCSDCRVAGLWRDETRGWMALTLALSRRPARESDRQQLIVIETQASLLASPRLDLCERAIHVPSTSNLFLSSFYLVSS